jgi:integrase/recombinase XerC
MRVEDVLIQKGRMWIRLYEKGGKEHTMPCHHNLEEYLRDYLEKSGLQNEKKAPLFPTIDRGTKALSRRPLQQSETYSMIAKRTAAAGIETQVGNHSFRATGLTVYLENGGDLQTAQEMANHASIKTTQLYDRRQENKSLDEVERVRY